MKKLYVLIRKDLPFPYRAVQAGHAVAEWLLQHGQMNKEWKNGTLIYLDVENEQDLMLWTERINRRGMQSVGFREPDIGDQMTAIACLTDSKVFSNLKLFGSGNEKKIKGYLEELKNRYNKMPINECGRFGPSEFSLNDE